MKKFMIDWLKAILTFVGWSCFAFVAAFMASTGFFSAKSAYDLSGDVAQVKFEKHTCFMAKGNMQCFEGGKSE